MKHIAAFKNPEFYSKQAMRISIYNIPRIICRADFTDEYLAMPRGCEDAIINMLYSFKIDYEIVDNTNHGKPIGVTFKGKERDEQLDAINALMPFSNGVLSATNSLWKDCYSRSSDCPKKDKYTYSGTLQGIAYAMA